LFQAHGISSPERFYCAVVLQRRKPGGSSPAQNAPVVPHPVECPGPDVVANPIGDGQFEASNWYNFPMIAN